MDAFAQRRTWQRGYRLALSQLLCLGRHTVTNLLATCGRQFIDWSGDYRLFSQARWDPRGVFRPVIGGVMGLCPDKDVFVVAMDDTHLRRSGKHTPGVSWGRDPLGPPFHCNLILRQRFIQVSAALYTAAPPAAARAVPIRFQHCPPVAKPKRSAEPAEWKEYRKQCRERNLCTEGAAILYQLRQELDQHHHAWHRLLVACVDASYFNQTVVKRLPERTCLIGRTRKDVKLFFLPAPPEQPVRGPHAKYGQPAPSPEQLRQDASIPWQQVTAFASGKLHTFRIKTIAPVLWAKAGADRPLRLVVIAPTGYRLRKGSRLLYRQPAYLLCTDPDLPVERLVQYYLWRWDIECDHREEKHVLGVGQAQVTAELSVQRQPELAVASYAMLLLAAARAFGQDALELTLPPPKWLANRTKPRVTIEDLLHQLRCEVWAHGLERLTANCDHFVNEPTADTKCPQIEESLPSAALYVRWG